jgi:hypothetical protein
VEWFPIESFYVILLYVLFGKKQIQKAVMQIWRMKWDLTLSRDIFRTAEKGAPKNFRLPFLTFFQYLFFSLFILFDTSYFLFLCRASVTTNVNHSLHLNKILHAPTPSTVDFLHHQSWEIILLELFYFRSKRDQNQYMECLLARNKIRKLNFTNFDISASWWLRKWQFM